MPWINSSRRATLRAPQHMAPAAPTTSAIAAAHKVAAAPGVAAVGWVAAAHGVVAIARDLGRPRIGGERARAPGTCAPPAARRVPPQQLPSSCGTRPRACLGNGRCSCACGVLVRSASQAARRCHRPTGRRTLHFDRRARRPRPHIVPYIRPPWRAVHGAAAPNGVAAAHDAAAAHGVHRCNPQGRRTA